MKKLSTLFVLFFLCHTFSFASEPEKQIRETNPNSDTSLFRAIHMGGNWGLNTFSVLEPPQEYFNFLNLIHANWVGISVALHIESSMDSTVERKYSGVDIPTFADEDLIRTIRALKANHFNVYLTLAFEMKEANNSKYPVERWQLGNPNMANEDSTILPRFWPWALDHPQHNRFIRKFWGTYTEQAIYYAKICEAEGVGLFSLGTETEGLFRTRPNTYWKNDFSDYLSTMADSVRHFYHGLLTYDQHYSALTDPELYYPSHNHLWEDLGLDVVGISAYFPLTENLPTSVTSQSSLEQKWEKIFNDYLIPLKTQNPDKPVLFLELGYTDAVGSPFDPNAKGFESKVFEDNNSNGLDDGEETQSNIYSAFFKVNEQNTNLVRGTFLWGNDMSNDEDWENSFGQLRTMSIRQKQAETKIRNIYEQYSISTSVHQQTTETPSRLILYQNYPNPCSQKTTIQYELPHPVLITLRVYNLSGQIVSTLIKQEQAAGKYSVNWNGTDDQGKALSSGIYYYSLQSPSHIVNKQLIIIR